MPIQLWLLVLTLVILHQDFWFWEDPWLVFGFMPVGLFYHVCLSIAAAIMWYFATRFWWPKRLETLAAAPGAQAASDSTAAGEHGA